VADLVNVTQLLLCVHGTITIAAKNLHCAVTIFVVVVVVQTNNQFVSRASTRENIFIICNRHNFWKEKKRINK